jgi:hypothetical protein
MVGLLSTRFLSTPNEKAPRIPNWELCDGVVYLLKIKQLAKSEVEHARKNPYPIR